MMTFEREARGWDFDFFSFDVERLQKNNSPKMYCVRFATIFPGDPQFGNLPSGGREVGEIKPSLLEYLRIFPRASEEINLFF